MGRIERKSFSNQIASWVLNPTSRNVAASSNAAKLPSVLLLSASAGAVIVLYIVVFVLLGVLDLQAASARESQLSDFCNEIHSRLTNLFSSHQRSTATVASFVQGCILSNGTDGTDPFELRFEPLFAPRLLRSSSFPLKALLLAAGGNVSHVCPSGYAAYFPKGSALIAHLNTTLPTLHVKTVPGIGHLLVVSTPVYNISAPDQLWGTVASIRRAGEGLLAFSEEQAAGGKYFLYESLDKTSGVETTLYDSFIGEVLDAVQAPDRSHLSGGTATIPLVFPAVSESSFNLHCWLAPHDKFLTPRTIAMVVLIPPGAMLLICFFISFAVHFGKSSYSKLQSQFSRAPSAPPFAAVLVGVHQLEEMWSAQPQLMLAIVAEFEERLHAVVASNRGFVVPSVLRHTYCLVTQDPGDALCLCRRIVEDLATRPVLAPSLGTSSSSMGASMTGKLSHAECKPAALRALTLMHWVTQATVRWSSVENCAQYEGADFVFLKRLYQFARPNVIVLSEQARSELLNKKVDSSMIFDEYTSVRFRGTTGVHNLFSVTCPGVSSGSLDAIETALGRNPLALSGVRRVQTGTVSEDEHCLGNGGESSSSRSKTVVQMSRSTMLQPSIPRELREMLESIFTPLAAFAPVADFRELQHLFFHYYSAFTVMFQPFSLAERLSIQKQLLIAFGVPQDNFLEHLAVRCVLRHVQDVRSVLHPQMSRHEESD